MVRRLVLVLLVLSFAAGCGSITTNLAGTKLTLTAFNSMVGKAVFHLTCAPAGGDVANATAACAALHGDPKLVTAPKPFICLGGPTSWWDVTISGRLAEKQVRRKFSTCWTPQMATLGKLGLASQLGRHVLRRRRGIVAAGTTRTFPGDSLRPGDLLVCTIRGHKLELGVPDTIGPMGSMDWGGKYVRSVVLTGNRRGDGSVTASCRRTSS